MNRCISNTSKYTALILLFSLCVLAQPQTVDAAPVTCTSGFKLIFMDVENGLTTGFNDQTMVGTKKLGQIRRETACAVMDYIGNTINLNSRQPVIQFDVSESDGNEALGAYTPQLPTSPFPGFSGNELQAFITTGVDINGS